LDWSRAGGTIVLFLMALAFGAYIFSGGTVDELAAQAKKVAAEVDSSRKSRESDAKAELKRRKLAREKTEQASERERARQERDQVAARQDRKEKSAKAPVAKPTEAKAAKLVVHGRSGAPVGETFRILVTVDNKGNADAVNVKVRVKLVAVSGDEIEVIGTIGPEAIPAGGRGKFTTSYTGEFVGIIKDFIPVVSFND